MYDLKFACDTDPNCFHRACHVCEKRIRPSGQLKHEHEGAVEGWVHQRLCLRCKIEGHKSIHDMPRPEPDPEPEVLADERHKLLSDAEMEHIMFEHPVQYTWHAERRKRLKLGEYS